MDAHAYLHRAYHALPPLSNAAGEPVGALYGFVRMLLALLRREKPDFLAVCFDAPGPTLRHRAYAGYKATRKETDQDLKFQLALARPLAESMGLKCVELQGYEADDLMATLGTEAASRGCEVVLVTTDKDAFQLVDERVRVLHEGKGLLFDSGKISEKYGVGPEQFVDYLALTGDASDNVPGVPGIGPVGAAKLLRRFGSLDVLLDKALGEAPELSAKAAVALRGAREQALRSRALVRLERRAPIDASLADCRLGAVRKDSLLPLLSRFEFHSFLRELAPESAEAQEAPPGRSAVAAPASPLKPWLQSARGERRICIAWTVASKAGSNRCSGSVALALALPDGRAAWAEPEDLRGQRRALAELLGGPCEKVAHDVKTLLSLLRREGLALEGPRFDTMLASYCLDPSRPGYDFRSVSKAAARAASSDDPRTAALEQARELDGLKESLGRALREGGAWSLYQDMELPLVDMLADMEWEGVGVDAPYLRSLGREFDSRIAELRLEIERSAGTEINPNSPRQLAKLLFQDLKLPVVHKTPKGGVSTDEETLLALRPLHPLPAKLLDYRELSKLKSTYIEGLLQRLDPDTGRIHTHFDQAGTATGRLSSLDPNLQNIPIRTPLGQKIRRAFIARPGSLLVSADYSQIDLRVLAHLSEDPALVDAFARGEDVHLKTACEIFGVPPDRVDAEMRRRAKAVNFGIVYGQTPHGLSQELGIPAGKAKDYIERYFDRYAGVRAWCRSCLETARENGFVTTLSGRARRLPDLAAKNSALRQFTERVAVNTPIQGSSADIIKRAMVAIHRKMRARPRPWAARPLLQVHDELLFESPEGDVPGFSEWLRSEMESCVRLKVPLRVDVKTGANWQDMRPLEART